MNTKETIMHGIMESWDEEEDLHPNEMSITQAVKFMELLPEKIKKPHLSHRPYGDEEVAFYWVFDGFYMELDVYPDGTYGYLARTDGWKKEIYGNDIPIETPLPEEIIEWLKEKTE